MSDAFLRYSDKKLSQERLLRIERINSIINEYSGMPLSVRQIFYQGVARGWHPNTDREYDLVQGLVNDGRMAGLISWTAIEDRNRQLMSLQTYDSPAQALQEAKEGYRTDVWATQRFRPEVWVEKAAMEGVVSVICNELRVDFIATRGYNSQSEQWRAGQRFQRYIRDGQVPIVFDLRDHDPSGLNMTEDVARRLEIFTGVRVMVQRLALNIDQVYRYNPPPNPAKPRDSRAADYIEKFGPHSWEMDALEPPVLQKLIRDAVLSVRDEKAWAEAMNEEAEDLELLGDMIEQAGRRLGPGAEEEGEE